MNSPPAKKSAALIVTLPFSAVNSIGAGVVSNFRLPPDSLNVKLFSPSVIFAPASNSLTVNCANFEPDAACVIVTFIDALFSTVGFVKSVASLPFR